MLLAVVVQGASKMEDFTTVRAMQDCVLSRVESSQMGDILATFPAQRSMEERKEHSLPQSFVHWKSDRQTKEISLLKKGNLTA